MFIRQEVKKHSQPEYCGLLAYQNAYKGESRAAEKKTTTNFQNNQPDFPVHDDILLMRGGT